MAQPAAQTTTVGPVVTWMPLSAPFILTSLTVSMPNLAPGRYPTTDGWLTVGESDA